MKKKKRSLANTGLAGKWIEYLDSTISYGFHFLLFTVPLAFLTITNDRFDLVKLVILQVGTIFILACWIAKQFLGGQIAIKRTRLDLFVLIFLAAGVVSTLNSIHPITSIVGNYFRYEGLLSLITYTLLFFLATQTFSDFKMVQSLQNSMIVSTSLISIYGLAQYLGYDFVQSKIYWEANRSISTLGNPVFLGGYLSLMLPMILSRYFESPNPGQQWLYGISALLTFSCIITTFSRGAWVAAIAGIIGFVVMAGKDVLLSRKTGYALVVVIGILSLILIINYAKVSTSPKANISLIERISSIPKIREGSFGARLLIWQSTLRMILRRPFLGWGLDTLRLVYPSFSTLKEVKIEGYLKITDNAHNYFLQLAATSGGLGLLAYLALVAILIRGGIERLSLSKGGGRILHCGLLASVLSYVIYLLSGINVVGIGIIFWTIAGVLSVQFTDKKVEQQLTWQIPRVLLQKRLVLLVFIFLTVLLIAYFPLKMFLADIYFDQAGHAAQAGFFDQAVEEYNLAIRLNPYRDNYLRHLAQLYAQASVQTGDKIFFNKAVGLYRKAKKINPYEVENYGFLGDLYLVGGQMFNQSYYSLAEKELSRAIEIYPYWASAYSDLGIIYFKTNNFKKAEREFKVVLKIDPRDVKSYLYLGRIYEALNEPERAVWAYKSVLRLDQSIEEAEAALKRLESLQN